MQVCRSLIELGVRFELEKFLADGCHTVDIVLRIPGKERSACLLSDCACCYAKEHCQRLAALGLGMLLCTKLQPKACCKL